jgi:2-oxoglutarate dehydrogenase E1 component
LTLLGYRKYGHNEGDEPRFTQPKLYKIIAKHPNPKQIYAQKLKSEGLIDDAYISEIEKEYKASLEEELDISRGIEKTEITPFMQDEWADYPRAKRSDMLHTVDTTFPKEQLEHIAAVISSLPADKNLSEK